MTGVGRQPAVEKAVDPAVERRIVERMHGKVHAALLRGVVVEDAVLGVTEIGVAAEKLGEGLDGKRRQFVPDSPKVLFVMGLVAPGQSGEMWFFAPEKPGTYPLVCTFPGHWVIMYGQLVVTKDVDAYLKQNPLAAKPAAETTKAATPAHNSHAH